MLEDRIGFAVGQKLDDEIPVVVSIMTSYSASASVLPKNSHGMESQRTAYPFLGTF